MQFKTSLDPLGKAVTWGGCALFGLLMLQRLDHFARSPREPVDVAAAVLEILCILSLPLFAWMFGPQGYSVRDGALVIHRPWKPLVIPLEEIQNVQLLTPQEVNASYRVFGAGGLFGYYGSFFRSNLGIVRFYLRNRENPILIDTATRGRLLLSPDSAELVQALNAAWTS